MNINLITLASDLSLKQGRIQKDIQEFLDEINVDKSFNFILNKSKNNRAMTVFFIASGGAEEKFKKLYKNYPEPYILLTSCVNNSLPATIEIYSYLSSHHLKAELVMGSVVAIREKLFNLENNYSSSFDLSHDTLGIIGHPSPWLIASEVDKKKVKRVFGLKLIDISMEEFCNEIDKKKYVNSPSLDKLRVKYKNKDTLEGAFYIYGAIKRLINKYHLAGVTIRCFDLLTKYKNTSCLALALLNDEGITATCEGDVPSLITMHFIRRVTGLPSFQCNPSIVNIEENSLLLAHCTIPFSMCESYSLDTHFESRLGVAVKGKLYSGMATIIKFSPDLSRAVGIEAKIEDAPYDPLCCRSQALVYFDQDVVTVEDFLTSGVGNHLILVYGTHLETFARVSLFTKLDEIREE